MHELVAMLDEWMNDNQIRLNRLNLYELDEFEKAIDVVQNTIEKLERFNDYGIEDIIHDHRR